MTEAELIDNLGTIARSGTRAFIEGSAGADGSALIGQFGVGFYSAFMVASSVEVISRRAGSSEAWRWRSDGKGTFTIEPAPLDKAPARGTRVTLTLLDDAKDLCRPGDDRAGGRRVFGPCAGADRAQARRRRGRKDARRRRALWRKPKSTVTPDEYAEFYAHVSGQYDEPALTVHYRAEGRNEYSVLLFVPSMKPFDLFDPERKGADQALCPPGLHHRRSRRSCRPGSVSCAA